MDEEEKRRFAGLLRKYGLVKLLEEFGLEPLEKLGVRCALGGEMDIDYMISELEQYAEEQHATLVLTMRKGKQGGNYCRIYVEDEVKP